ncbi:MAG: DUF692 family multinuclear iron-containing protein [Bacteroidota bacterium]
MSKIFSSIACNLDVDLLASALPLFHGEHIEAIEWSFDTLFKVRNIPSWFGELLEEFSKANRLIGHGVFFSMFSGRWAEEQDRWLAHLKKVSTYYNFEHISEHFGFMTGENFHSGAPISIPCTSKTLEIGQDRLKRIFEACACPVGLENLAFAYSLDEVKRHGAFLDELLEPVNGFIILDLHNLYCHLHNFNLSFEELIKLYPIDRVREIHISGGTWADSKVDPGRQIRRDTHDTSVPTKVFDLLEKVIPLCMNLKFVVLEQIGSALNTKESQTQFGIDFLKMKSLTEKYNAFSEANNVFYPPSEFDLGSPVQDEELYLQQHQLSTILENAEGIEDAKNQLSHSALANSAWDVENWDPAMLETVIAIARKWK